MKAPLLLLALSSALAACATPSDSVSSAASPTAPANPVELGAVRWHRNLEVANAEARRRDDPLLVLFQEVPG